MARGVMTVFEELLLRKMREGDANFDDFPQEAIDNWSAYMFDQRAELDKCEPLLRDTTALLQTCETEKHDLRNKSEGLEKALTNEIETTSRELNLRVQVQLATDTISDLQNQLLRLKADARGEAMLMRTKPYERSKRMLMQLKDVFVMIMMCYMAHEISTLAREETKKMIEVQLRPL